MTRRHRKGGRYTPPKRDEEVGLAVEPGVAWFAIASGQVDGDDAKLLAALLKPDDNPLSVDEMIEHSRHLYETGLLDHLNPEVGPRELVAGYDPWRVRSHVFLWIGSGGTLAERKLRGNLFELAAAGGPERFTEILGPICDEWFEEARQIWSAEAAIERDR